MTPRIRTLIAVGVAVLVPALSGTVLAQQPADSARLHAEIAALKAELTAYQDQLDSQMTALREATRQVQAGTNRFVVTGYGVAGYTSIRDGSSEFSSKFSPILLWQLNDRLLFQGETEFEMEEELEVGIEYAQVSVLATDFLSLGAGKFLTPFTIFAQRLHAAWINKLPSAPLAFNPHGGLVPAAGVGAYARGGFPVGLARGSYAVYAMNAPLLVTDGHHAGEIEAIDASDERTYGARVGLFMLRQGVEVGYSYMTADVVSLHGVDVSIARQIPRFGNLDARLEGVVSDAEDGPYPAEMEGEEDRFYDDNRRVGGYAQLGYRPSLARSRVMRNVELVGRYDVLNRPDWRDGARGNDTKAYSVGLNYWVTPSMLLKMAWQRADNTQRADATTYLLQLATGF